MILAVADNWELTEYAPDPLYRDFGEWASGFVHMGPAVTDDGMWAIYQHVEGMSEWLYKVVAGDMVQVREISGIPTSPGQMSGKGHFLYYMVLYPYEDLSTHYIGRIKTTSDSASSDDDHGWVTVPGEIRLLAIECGPDYVYVLVQNSDTTVSMARITYNGVADWGWVDIPYSAAPFYRSEPMTIDCNGDLWTSIYDYVDNAAHIQQIKPDGTVVVYDESYFFGLITTTTNGQLVNITTGSGS